MAHVQIHAESGQDAKFSCLIDGTDISASIEAFDIEWPQNIHEGDPVVVLRVHADVLDLDVPQAVLDAVMTKAGA